MKAKETLIPVCVNMPSQLKKALEKAAKEDDRSIAATIRFLMKQYIDSKSE